MTLPIIMTESDIRRFHNSYLRRKDDECWLSFKVNDKGYGKFYINRVQFRMHRIAYFLAYKIDPKELEVCHTCDLRKCCNPAHLFLGTHYDNMLDAKNKGRFVKVAFSIDDVKYIHQKINEGQSQEILADYFSVDQSTISDILTGNRKSPLFSKVS